MRTLLVTLCSGLTAPGCAREIAHELVEWRGAPVVESHGVCVACSLRELRAAALNREEAE